MVFLKTIFIIVPLLIVFISVFFFISLRNVFSKKNSVKKIKNEILTCAVCNISVHESIALNKNKKTYCSEDCFNS